jgi:outer membrane protein, heavy metal efflux system
MTLPKFILLTASVPLGLSGCAGVNPEPAFKDVNQTVTARLGSPVRWPLTATDRPAADPVAALLRADLTAQSATAVALLNSRSLQASFEEIGISQAELAQASRLPDPLLAAAWRIPDRPPSAVDAEYSVAGDILGLLTLPARKQIAARNLEQTKLAVADGVLRLAARAQTAFYTLQAQMQLAGRLGVIAAVNDAAADVARRQFAAGDIAALELREQQAAAAQSHFDLMQAQAKVQTDRERLNRVLGLADGQLGWHLAPTLPALPPPEPPLNDLEAVAIGQRLDLAALRRHAESLADALRLQQHTRYLAGLNLGVDTERMPDGQRVTGPTLDLGLPLFDQGQPAVAKLAAEYRQARDTYQARAATVRSEVREARADLLASRAAVEFADRELLPLRQQVLGETLLRYNAMAASTGDLLLAKEREQTAEAERIGALRDYWLARVALERAVGGRLAAATRDRPGGPELPAPKPQPGS